MFNPNNLTKYFLKFLVKYSYRKYYNVFNGMEFIYINAQTKTLMEHEK